MEVTRYRVSGAEETPQRYYYSFRIDGLYYFTYGGEEPTKPGYSFTGWRMTAGGTGFGVTRDSTFTAQFQAGATYIINVYYYYSDGSRVTGIPTQTLTYSASDPEIASGTIQFQLNATERTYYDWVLAEPPQGVTVDAQDKRQVTVDVTEAYAGAQNSTTKFLALTVVYSPADVTYTVEYYQQKVGPGTDPQQDYNLVGTTAAETKPYGSLVTVADRPSLDNVSFDGFAANRTSLLAINGGCCWRMERSM